MRRSKGKCDIFFGKRHRLRKEELKRASSEDRKHTSGGVFIAVDGDLVTVVGERAGAVASIPGNESRITQAWVNVRRGMRVFSVYFWHSEGWTRGMKLDGGSVQASQSHETSVADGM